MDTPGTGMALKPSPLVRGLKFLQATSIKNKLIRLFLIMGLTPALISMLITYFGVTNNLERQTGAFLKDWSKDIALRVNEYIQGKVELTRWMAEDTHLRELYRSPAGPSEIPGLVQSFMDHDKDLFNITLITGENRIRLAFPFYLFEPEDLDRWSRDFYVLKPGEILLISEVRHDPRLPKRLHAVAPVWDADREKPHGHMILSFDLRALIGIIQNIPTTGQDYICLLDEEGNILSDTQNRKQLYTIPRRLIQRFGKKDNDWIRDYDELFGTSSVFGHATIQTYNQHSVPGNFWKVYVSKNRDTFLAPIHRFMLQLLGFCLLVVLSILWLFNNRIRSIWRPILTLKQGAEQIGSGDFDTQLSIPTGDELETLAQAFNQMGENLKDSHQALKNQNIRLIELNEAKNRFLSMVSHELRTPLVIIKEALSQVLGGLRGPVVPAQENFLQMAFRNTGRLNKIVNDLLNISGIETGRMKLNRARTDLVTLLRNEISNHKLQSDEKNITVIESYEQKTAEIYCDRDKVTIAFTNLIGNAIKFVPSGGRIEVSLERLPKQMRVTVKDNGPGFPAELSEKIFDRFFRVNATPLVGNPSAGLGLAIARELLHMQGGEIWAESIPGEGAAFTFTLPRYDKLTYMRVYFDDRIQEARDRELDLTLFHIQVEVFDLFQDKITADRVRRAFVELVEMFQENPLDLLEIIAMNESMEIYTFAFLNAEDALVVCRKIQQIVDQYLQRTNLVDQVLGRVATATLEVDGSSRETMLQFVANARYAIRHFKQRKASLLELLSRKSPSLAEKYQTLPSAATSLEPFIEDGLITVPEARALLNASTDLPCLHPEALHLARELVDPFGIELLKKYRFLPVTLKRNRLTLALVDPFDLSAIQIIMRRGAWELDFQYILQRDFDALLEAYSRQTTPKGVI